MTNLPISGWELGLADNAGAVTSHHWTDALAVTSCYWCDKEIIRCPTRCKWSSWRHMDTMLHQCNPNRGDPEQYRRFAWDGTMSVRTIQLARKGYAIGLDPDVVVIHAKTRLQVLTDTRSLG